MSGRDITENVPPRVIHDINAYVKHRAELMPRTFVRAIVANNFLDAIAYAPNEYCKPEQLRAIARFIFNQVPPRARGSDVAVACWITGQTPDDKDWKT